MGLLTIEDFCEIYDKSDNSIAGLAHYQGYDNCKWYVKYDGRVYIDVDEYMKPSSLYRKTWMHCTDTIYWLMLEIYGNNYNMSKMLADASHRFNSQTSWSTWLNSGLFENPDKNIVSMTYLQIHDFYRISMRKIAIAIKMGMKLGKDFE